MQRKAVSWKGRKWLLSRPTFRQLVKTEEVVSPIASLRHGGLNLKKKEMEPADTTLVMETYGLNCDPMDDANFICLDILLAEQAMHVS